MSRPARAAAATTLAAMLALTGCSSDAGPATDASAPPTTAPAVSPTAAETEDTERGAAARRGDEGDIRFAKSMLAHHSQGAEMTEMAADTRRHAASAAIRKLAGTIADAQRSQTQEMLGWLEAWGIADSETLEATETAEPVEPAEPVEQTGTVEAVEPTETVEPAETVEPTAPGDADSAPTAPGEPPGIMSPGRMEQLGGASGEQFDQLWLQMMIDHHAGTVTASRDVLQTTANPQVEELADKMVHDLTAEIDTMRGMLSGPSSS